MSIRHENVPPTDALREQYHTPDDFPEIGSLPSGWWVLPAALIGGILIGLALWWLIGPVMIAIAEASVPVACADAGAEIVACVQEGW